MKKSLLISTGVKTHKVVTDCDHLGAWRLSHVPVYAFAEQIVAMLATVLKSDISIRTRIDIMDALVAMRNFMVLSAVVLQRIGALKEI